MQHSLFSSMKSLKLIDGCKGTQIFPFSSSPPVYVNAEENIILDHNHHGHKHSHSRSRSQSLMHQSISVVGNILPFGLPDADNLEPPIEPFIRSLDFVEVLADLYRRVNRSDELGKSLIYLEQFSVVRCLGDPKLLRRCLRSARQYAVDVHSKVVLSAWLKFERREDELTGSRPMSCGTGIVMECVRCSLRHGCDSELIYNDCPCRMKGLNDLMMEEEEVEVEEEEDEDECSTSTSNEDEDVSFCIGDEDVRCVRFNIASLSRPLKTMLYGGFRESRRETISFTHNEISAKGMKAIELYSRMKRVDTFPVQIVLEILSFANRFCCEELKSACDLELSMLVNNLEDALLLIEYGLEEFSYLLVAACLQVFLRELPWSLHNPNVVKLFCGMEARKRLEVVGQASFLLYYFLSQVAMEEDMKSNTTVTLLERLGECAITGWQKQLAMHQLGCVMLERKEYKDAQYFFQTASEAGHIYSLAGVARSKFKKGHKYLAYKQMNSLVSECKEPAGWMYQEQSLYCIGKEKMMDLRMASDLDPTLSYPYKYRAATLVAEDKIGAAISEISKIIGFKVSPDCLDLRAWISIVFEDYEGALRDVRALLTLDHTYKMFNGKMHGDYLVDLLKKRVKQSSQAECWMQLHDRWSCVDDIGSLAVVHEMLVNDPGRSLLLFRQSLLLIRLNFPKAAMRSLRLACDHSSSEHERLVYEGWIYFDTGHCKEAIARADMSIDIQRSFEAFFLKAYALADTNLESEVSSKVIQLLEEALRCPSDGLRKGQALNNLGNIYVDCHKEDVPTLNKAEACFVNALDIRHTRAHQGLARVYLKKKSRTEAYDEMTKLIKKARNNASAYEKRSEYCERDTAKCDLSTATQLDPLRIYPYRYRAAVLMDDDKHDEAIAELSKPISFIPDLQLLNLRATFYGAHFFDPENRDLKNIPEDFFKNLPYILRDFEAALSLDPSHECTLVKYNDVKGLALNEEIFFLCR